MLPVRPKRSTKKSSANAHNIRLNLEKFFASIGPGCRLISMPNQHGHVLAVFISAATYLAQFPSLAYVFQRETVKH